MNLLELKDVVDYTISNLGTYIEASDISVVITLKENSIGARAKSDVEGCYLGFDWESNQFRIEPKKDLIGYNSLLSNEKVTTNCICQVCGRKISKADKFCKHCGKRLK